MNVSILIPSRNGVEFLDWAYKSIRKNQGKHHVEILVLDDISDKDNTREWCFKTMCNDPLFTVFTNETKTRYGISGGYKFLSQFATQEIICHWHNDMFMTEGTLDVVEKYLYKHDLIKGKWIHKTLLLKNVVCLTRIEPTIYIKGGIYPEKIVWENAPIELVDWDENKFYEYLPTAKSEWNDKTTHGHFAPFFMFRSEYLRLGGNDTVNFPLQAREDSDFAFRLVLDGCNTYQIPHFTFHFASRGNRRSKHESGNFIDNPEWQKIDQVSTKNFIRKWQTFNLHDEWLKPTPPSRFKTTFHIKNSNIDLIYLLEPWCDFLKFDTITTVRDNIVYDIITDIQQSTQFDIDNKFYNIPEIPNILVEIDCRTFNDLDFNYIQNLSAIINDTNELGEFQIGNLKVTINDLTHYEHELIEC